MYLQMHIRSFYSWVHKETHLSKKFILASTYDIPSAIEDMKNSRMYSRKIGVKPISPYVTIGRHNPRVTIKYSAPPTHQMYLKILPISAKKSKMPVSYSDHEEMDPQTLVMVLWVL
jgi:hypothetical protein